MLQSSKSRVSPVNLVWIWCKFGVGSERGVGDDIPEAAPDEVAELGRVPPRPQRRGNARLTWGDNSHSARAGVITPTQPGGPKVGSFR